MENVIITKPHQTVANLAELAAQINSEHGHVETAIRNGLERARGAGLLLLQAKTRVPHGNWTPWLETNCKITSRTAQRYMKVAENWEQLVAKGGKRLGLKGALNLLARTDGPEPKTTPVSFLPPALAYYNQNGLIDDDVAAQLMELEQDHGPEILTKIQFSLPQEEISETWLFLNEIRPLDQPAPWPIYVPDDEPAGRALTAATRIFFEDGHTRDGQVPQWEVTAFWFGSTMMQLATAFPKAGAEKEIASILRHHLQVWRESFRTALVFVGCYGPEFIKENDGKEIYWAYHSDLRHAGVAAEALEIKENPGSHYALANSLKGGLEEIDQHDGNYVLPSAMQGRLDRLRGQEDSVSGNDDPLTNGEPQ